MTRSYNTRVILKYALVVLIFGGLAALALRDVLLHLDTHLPTEAPGVVTDYYHFHWNYGWIRHALTNGLDVYHTNYVFAPFESSLAFHTLTPMWYPLWALVEPLAGNVAAMAAVMWAAFTLTGLAMFAFLRDLRVSAGLALAGGIVFMHMPQMRQSMEWTIVSLMAWFWLPVILLIWRRAARGGLIWAGLLGVALWAMLLTDLQYPLMLAPVVIPVGLWWLFSPHPRPLPEFGEGRFASRFPTRKRSLVAASEPAASIDEVKSDFVVRYGLTGSDNKRRRLPSLNSGRGWGRGVFSGVITVIIAVALLWIGGTLSAILSFESTGLAMTPAERAAEVKPLCLVVRCDVGMSYGWLILPALVIAVIVSLRRRARDWRWFWLALVPIPLWLSLGASGGLYVPLHNALGGMFRYPERFAPAAIFAALVFVGLTFAPYVRGRLGVSGLIILLALADANLFEPIPLMPQPTDYAFYHDMAREPYDYIVVEVPTGGSSGQGIVGQPEYSALQYYGVTHGKRMVNGHVSRVNTYNYFYMNTDDPMMAWLGQRRLLEPETVAAQMRSRIWDWQIGYFVIHRDLIGRDSVTVTEILTFFNQQRDLVCPYAVEGDAVVYRTQWHPDGCADRTPPPDESGAYVIDIGANEDAFYLGEGWHYAESIFDTTLRWTGAAAQAELYLDLPPRDYTLTITAQAYAQPRALTVLVNDSEVGTVMVGTEALTPFTFEIPAAAVGDGEVQLTLVYDATITPAESGGDDPRALAVMMDRVVFEGS